jgi:hypothetical protein
MAAGPGAVSRPLTYDELIAECALLLDEPDLDEVRWWVDRAIAEGVIPSATVH